MTDMKSATHFLIGAAFGNQHSVGGRLRQFGKGNQKYHHRSNFHGDPDIDFDDDDARHPFVR